MDFGFNREGGLSPFRLLCPCIIIAKKKYLKNQNIVLTSRFEFLKPFHNLHLKIHLQAK